MTLLVRAADEGNVYGRAGTGVGVRGTGGGTSSCASRDAEGNAAAVCVCRAAPSMCVVDGGADLYFLLHSAVV